MFADRLELPEALGWETVPSEHESLLAEFKQQQDAFNSVRALEPEPVAEPPVPTPEPPVIEDEPKPKKRGGRSKKESTALTQKKAEAIQDNRQNATQTHSGVAETLTILYSAVFKEVLEHQPMTALFPTFGNLLQRAKRLLSSDVSFIWHRFLDACEADAERYQRELEAKGHDDFYPGLYW